MRRIFVISFLIPLIFAYETYGQLKKDGIDYSNFYDSNPLGFTNYSNVWKELPQKIDYYDDLKNWKPKVW